jgi:predicted CoA-substrate-specific enzyme activase
MNTVGIDIGSLTTKVAVLGDEGMLSCTIVNTGDDAEAVARQAAQDALAKAGCSLGEDVYVISTGVGGKAISFSQQQKAITTCLARGTSRLLPSARMVIDMGAESCTVVKLSRRGRVDDWATHDKCAAGTGIFLQQMARLMQLPLEEMSALSRQAASRAEITGTCAVFAESDVISHVHRDPPTPTADIIAGIYYSVVARIVSLCKRIGIEREVSVAGGVALNRGLVDTLSSELGFEVLVPESPQLTAALGAAILARESVEKGLTG